MTTSQPLFDFSPDADVSAWTVEDDTVMGGVSDGHFKVNDAGHGVFFGHVSLENNGGFSSLRYRFDKMKVVDFEKICIRLRGDGKRYQCRVKSNMDEKQSYIAYFETTGKWQTVEIDLAGMKPTYRGETPDLPDYPGETMAEFGLLIGNKKEQDFKLELDWLRLE